MKKGVFRDTVITVLILTASLGLSVAFQNVFEINEHVSTLFAFAVFLISFFTEGYLYGIVSAFLGTLAINYAFTFPYFAFNFTIPVNLISAIVMVTIALLTGALTTKIKQQELIKAESEKERMRANLMRAVSHDIRTPLTTIYGAAATLKENDLLNEEQKKKLLSDIMQDADWLVKMVENLLSVTKIGSGNVKIIKTATVVDELIDSVLLKFKKRYPDEQVTVSLPDEITVVPMDALLIEQVMVNLLDNAVLHGKNRTMIELRVSVTHGKAVFEIEDDGGGIPEEKLERLFYGYSGDSYDTADSRKKNAGIGLSVCAAIIKSHGGEISAVNTEKGALVSFALDTEAIYNEQ